MPVKNDQYPLSVFADLFHKPLSAVFNDQCSDRCGGFVPVEHIDCILRIAPGRDFCGKQCFILIGHKNFITCGNNSDIIGHFHKLNIAEYNVAGVGREGQRTCIVREVADAYTRAAHGRIAGCIIDFHKVQAAGGVDNGDCHGSPYRNPDLFGNIDITVSAGDSYGLITGRNPAIVTDFCIFQRVYRGAVVDGDYKRVIADGSIQEADGAIAVGIAVEARCNRAGQDGDNGTLKTGRIIAGKYGSAFTGIGKGDYRPDRDIVIAGINRSALTWIGKRNYGNIVIVAGINRSALTWIGKRNYGNIVIVAGKYGSAFTGIGERNYGNIVIVAGKYGSALAGVGKGNHRCAPIVIIVAVPTTAKIITGKYRPAFTGIGKGNNGSGAIVIHVLVGIHNSPRFRSWYIVLYDMGMEV